MSRKTRLCPPALEPVNDRLQALLASQIEFDVSCVEIQSREKALLVELIQQMKEIQNLTQAFDEMKERFQKELQAVRARPK